MKKILLGIVMLFALGSTAKLAAQIETKQQQRVKFYYYPSSNVYYNVSTGEYEYYDQPTTTWMTVKTLPSTITIEKTSPKYTVYYNGTDVWKDNAIHMRKYKEKRNGVVKTKPHKEY